MSALSKLRAADSLPEIAKLLGFTPKGLAFVLYKQPAPSKYKTFKIPKKSGGSRQIDAPVPQLKLLQRRLAELLSDCIVEIETERPNRRRVSHGFHRERSIVTNAIPHRKHRYVLNLDLRDFFGTINFGRVRGYFLSDSHFKLSTTAATVVAQIACHKNHLPQGSPCSPAISNLIGHIIDVRLVKLAAENGCTYTRYADDLTFSTNKREFPSALARRSKSDANRWILGKRLKNEIKDAGFSANPAKTRMQIRGSRQEVTGLVINEKINVRQDRYRLVRAQCHSLFRNGAYYPDGDVLQATTNLAPLEGSLAHIFYIKSRQDRHPSVNRAENFETPQGARDLYGRFVFFKHFIAGVRPKIVTEGKSDIAYIRAALIALSAQFPNLVETLNGKVQPKVDFLHPSPTTQTLLDLGNGTGGLSKLIDTYDKRLLDYAKPELSGPVIIVTDNDQGAECVQKAASRKVGKKITKTSADEFHALTGNLYFTQVPGADGKDTAIEDLFPPAVLQTKVDGKPFDKNKLHGDATAYGKVVFADKVVRPNIANIDFSGFKPLLVRIEAAINHHAAGAAKLAATG